MKEDLPPDAKCKDKFLVQSVAITADREFTNVSQLVSSSSSSSDEDDRSIPSPERDRIYQKRLMRKQWSNIEKTAKSMIQEKKIRVFFLPPEGGVASTPAKHLNGAPAEDSPAPEVYTPERGTSTAAPASESKSEARDSSSTSAKAEKLSSSIAAAIPTSAEELKAQLADAKATIARLTEQQGLRQRKGGEKKADGESGAPRLDMQQAPAGGVPVPVVAGLCLFSFLLAYLLF
jgi:hypothetical protein